MRVCAWFLLRPKDIIQIGYIIGIHQGLFTVGWTIIGDDQIAKADLWKEQRFAGHQLSNCSQYQVSSGDLKYCHSEKRTIFGWLAKNPQDRLPGLSTGCEKMCSLGVHNGLAWLRSGNTAGSGITGTTGTDTHAAAFCRPALQSSSSLPWRREIWWPFWWHRLLLGPRDLPWRSFACICPKSDVISQNHHLIISASSYPHEMWRNIKYLVGQTGFIIAKKIEPGTVQWNTVYHQNPVVYHHLLHQNSQYIWVNYNN